MLGLLLSGPAAGLAWWLLPDEYTAVEYVRIASNHAPLIFETVDTQGRFDVKSFKNTQRQLLIQPVALSKALKESGMLKNPIVAYEEDPVRWLQKKLKVTFPDEAEIMNVSLRSEWKPSLNTCHRDQRPSMHSVRELLHSRSRPEWWNTWLVFRPQ